MDEERCCRTMKTDFPDLWNNENLDFSTFSGSLFVENHWFILINSSLTVIKECVYVAVLKKTTKNKTKQNKTKKKKKIAQSANIIGTSTFEELGRSFTSIKNNNGLSIEPCGTPSLISFSTVSADSIIFIYCFLPFK